MTRYFERHSEVLAGLVVLLATSVVIWSAFAMPGWWPKGAFLVLFAITMAIGLFYLVNSPIRPVITLISLTPFEGILPILAPAGVRLFTHAITPMIIVTFMLGIRTRMLEVFAGSRIQLLAIFFVISMLPSFVPGLLSLNLSSYITLGQRVALVLLLGMVAYLMADKARMALSARIITATAALMALFAISNFYVGGLGLGPVTQISDAIRGETGLLSSVDIDLLQTNPITTDFRLRGVEDSTEINRFAMWMLLPIFTAIGWLMTSKSLQGKLFAGACFTTLFVALAGTASRSGLLGLFVGLGILGFFGLSTAGFRRLILGVGVAVSIVAFYLYTQTGVGDLAIARIIEGWLHPGERLPVWGDAISRLWSPMIISGAGADLFGKYSPDPVYGRSAHNAFLQLAIETGITSAVLFFAIVTRTLWVLSRPLRSDDRELTLWQYVFLAGLVAMLVSNLFNVYTFERFLWIAVGFGVSIEHRRVSRQAEIVGSAQSG